MYMDLDKQLQWHRYRRKYRKRNINGNSIFLPAAGYRVEAAEGVLKSNMIDAGLPTLWHICVNQYYFALSETDK